MITYQITRNDSVLYNYIDSGHYEILVTQDEQHDDDGYYKIGDKGYWLCLTHEHTGYKDNPKQDTDGETENPYAEIVCDNPDNIIYAGLGAVSFTAIFYDADGNVIEDTPEWSINCDFKDKLQIDYINNTICISVDDFALINKSFELFLDGYEDTKQTISIVGLL